MLQIDSAAGNQAAGSGGASAIHATGFQIGEMLGFSCFGALKQAEWQRQRRKNISSSKHWRIARYQIDFVRHFRGIASPLGLFPPWR